MRQFVTARDDLDLMNSVQKNAFKSLSTQMDARKKNKIPFVNLSMIIFDLSFKRMFIFG